MQASPLALIGGRSSKPSPAPSRPGAGDDGAARRSKVAADAAWRAKNGPLPGGKHANGHATPEPPPERPDFTPAVADFLSVIASSNLKIKADRRLLGDFITSSTRAFLSGATGIGKTMFLYGMVGGMASGQGFLHWTCDGPSKWLIIDGEMPKVLVKGRLADLLRRAVPSPCIPTA